VPIWFTANIFEDFRYNLEKTKVWWYITATQSQHITFKDGLVIVIRTLDYAHLPQLFVCAAAGNVSLDVEAITLPLIQFSQFYHTALRVVDFLRTPQKNKQSIWGRIQRYTVTCEESFLSSGISSCINVIFCYVWYVWIWSKQLNQMENIKEEKRDLKLNYAGTKWIKLHPKSPYTFLLFVNSLFGLHVFS